MVSESVIIRNYVVEHMRFVPLLASIASNQSSNLTDEQLLKILNLLCNVTVDIEIDDASYLIGFVDYLIELISGDVDEVRLLYQQLAIIHFCPPQSKQPFWQVAISLLFNLSHRSATVRQMIFHIINPIEFGKYLQNHGFLGSIMYSLFGPLRTSNNSGVNNEMLKLCIMDELPKAFANGSLLHLKYIVAVMSKDTERFCSPDFVGILHGLLENLQCDATQKTAQQLKCISLIFQIINTLLRIEGKF